MTLRKYKIEDDGIWISRAELEQIREHYHLVGDKYRSVKSNLKALYYFGKRDFALDLLKHFDTEDETH